MTLLASKEIVLQMTAPQPSSNALPMTFALVPGGPEPMTKGLGSFNPLTVVASVGMTNSKWEPRMNADERRFSKGAETVFLNPRSYAFLRGFASVVSEHQHVVDDEPE